MRLGLIGSIDNKRKSGVYSPNDTVELQNAKKYVRNFGYDNIFNALATTAGNEESIDVSRDGRYVYVAVRGTRLTAKIFQYECSVPWDLSTITYTGKELLVGDYGPNVNAITISDDGTRLFFAGVITDTVWPCVLSTPYDISTATLEVKNFYLGFQDSVPSTPIFGDNGSKMYVMGNVTDRVFQYSLSTAWDVTTAAYDNISFSVTSQETLPRGLFFKDDGSAFYVVGTTSDTVYQYTVSTPWDISTASYASKSFSVAAQELTPTALFFNPDGLKMYVIGQTGDDVNEYDLSVAWDVSTASFVRASAAVGEATPTGLWFKEDGTKMYVIGESLDAVREFTLSTPWDVSTISFSQSLSVGFDTATRGVTFKDDGTVLYVFGATLDCVFQIPLGTAWDVTTAKGFKYLGALTIRGLHINNDGTLLYVGGSTDFIRKYTLSTPYAIETAVQSQTFGIAGLQGIHVFPDGLKIYAVIDNGGARGGRQVAQINLTSPHDLSTATVDGAENIILLYGLTGACSTPWGVRVSPDGSRMFLLSDVVQGIYQFSMRFA